MRENLKKPLEVATQAALEAGEITLKYFKTALRVDTKADRTPVTVADREAEEHLFAVLMREYPDDGFLGEERGERPGTSGYRWIVDPIDGTKSFIQGVPLYGVMVALEGPGGEPLVGVVNLPALDELVAAAKGEGCHSNREPARVSGVSRLEEACITYTSLHVFEKSGSLEAFERLRSRARICRGWGDCFGHVLVATGRAEVMLDPILSDWDCAALLPILEEAGGTFTDWRGNRTYRGKSGISTNGKLAGAVRAMIDRTIGGVGGGAGSGTGGGTGGGNAEETAGGTEEGGKMPAPR